MSRRSFSARSAALVGALAFVGVVPVACGGGDRLEATPVTTVPGPYTFDYTIPRGTADDIAAGIDPGIMPSSLTANVGDTIRIVNDDVKSHTIGTFYVIAGSTLTYRFTTPGVFEGECSTNADATFILTVLD